MTLDNDIKNNLNEEHPYIHDNGTIKKEGEIYILGEFKRRREEEGCSKAVEFYSMLLDEGKQIIHKEYGDEIINMRTCRRCSRYFR